MTVAVRLSVPPELRSRMPNLLVIGAGKCGTSALHFYLSLHPEIGMSERKELQLFGGPRERVQARLPTYASRFPTDTSMRGEASPSYTMWPAIPEVPEQMTEVLEEPRFVYIVGDPVTRVVAHWAEQYRLRNEPRPFEQMLETLDQPDNPYVCGSRYGSQLERYLRCFPEDRILVVDQRELRADRRATLRRVFEFAGVDPDFDSPRFEQEVNEAATKFRPHRLAFALIKRRVIGPRSRFPDLSRFAFLLGRKVHPPPVGEELHERLATVLAADIARFRELTGRKFAHWSL